MGGETQSLCEFQEWAIENLIPEGECVASLVSVKDQSELDVGMTQACLDAFDIKRVKTVLRGDSPTPTQASKRSVFANILMEESNRLTILPARRFVYTQTFSQQITHVLLIFE